MAVLRPAVVFALLLIGAAVGVALVIDSSPPEPTSPVVPTSVADAAPVEPEPTPPTSVYVPPTTTPPATVAEDVQPPHLEITAPEEGTEFETDGVVFEGLTDPEARVLAGKWEADVESSGEWSILLFLREGKNTVKFTAKDAAGNESYATVTVYYAPPAKPTTTTVKELAEFTAFTTFGSCSESPPYDIYYGTGEPGSKVNITSPYGSGWVEVDEEGNWSKKVIFETAPADKVFTVTVNDDFGRKKQFEFVYQPA